MMKVVFEFTTKYGIFRDALYLPDGCVLTEAQLESLKQERLNNWIWLVENPPEIDPSIELGDAENG